MSEVMEPMIHEDALPGHESQLEPKPDWAPRYPGSGRLEGKVALITGAALREQRREVEVGVGFERRVGRRRTFGLRRILGGQGRDRGARRAAVGAAHDGDDEITRSHDPIPCNRLHNREIIALFQSFRREPFADSRVRS